MAFTDISDHYGILYYIFLGSLSDKASKLQTSLCAVVPGDKVIDESKKKGSRHLLSRTFIFSLLHYYTAAILNVMWTCALKAFRDVQTSKLMDDVIIITIFSYYYLTQYPRIH